jgi:hypothetical protein
MKVTTYHCKRCQSLKTPVQENGTDKIKRMRSGYVARFLECGHSIPVTQHPITAMFMGEDEGYVQFPPVPAA